MQSAEVQESNGRSKYQWMSSIHIYTSRCTIIPFKQASVNIDEYGGAGRSSGDEEQVHMYIQI